MRAWGALGGTGRARARRLPAAGRRALPSARPDATSVACQTETRGAAFPHTQKNIPSFSLFQTASGAVACQLMDALHPGSVSMAKVWAWQERAAFFLAAVIKNRAACPQKPHPPLFQVDFNSRSEYDSINNYKALQAAFDRVGVDKVRRV